MGRCGVGGMGKRQLIAHVEITNVCQRINLGRNWGPSDLSYIIIIPHKREFANPKISVDHLSIRGF